MEQQNVIIFSAFCVMAHITNIRVFASQTTTNHHYHLVLTSSSLQHFTFHRYRGEPKKISTPGDGTIVHDGSYDLMSMNGRRVYSFATREVPNVIQEALDQAGITVDQVDHLLLHQANIRIMEVVADRLGMPMEKVITNLYKYGNTSAASIPLALDEAVRTGRVKKGDVIACAGFGAGLSWGAAILKWG